MPNLTPPEYRVLYQIYPGKAALHETAKVLADNVIALVGGLGRTVGKGAGGRRAPGGFRGSR
jgi:biotin synthase